MKVCTRCSRRYPDNALRCPEDGTALVDLTPETMPALTASLMGRRMFGDYVVERKLGEGGMGTVYLAKNVSIDQSIAIKVLHGHAAENSELVQRFNREAKAIARLTHPNIIRVFIFGHTQDGLIYLAMEYVQGQSLRHLIESRGRLSERLAIYILKQVLGALAEAHELGIIHRDLKPDNILLTHYRGNPNFVKVVDFGIAKVKEPDGTPEVQLTQAGVVYGTPEYLSPEQAQAKTLDGRSDLYSTGVILWEMLTGDVPFTAKTAMAVLVQHVYDAPGDPRDRRPDISPIMAVILKRALEKDPDRRFQSAGEFLEALSAAQAEFEGRPRTAVEQRDIEGTKSQVWSPPSGLIEEVSTGGPPPSPASAAPYPTPSGGYVPSDNPSPFLLPQGSWPSDEMTGPPSRARRTVVALLVAGLVLLAILAIVTVAVLLRNG